MGLFKKIFGQTAQDQKTAGQTESQFDTYRDRIYPWIKVTFTYDETDQGSEPIALPQEDSPIVLPWLDDLTIFYAHDRGDDFRLLLIRDVPKDLSIDQLHEIAIENLNRDIEFNLNQADFGGYFLSAGGDHEAGSICIPGIWDWITDNLDDSVIVAIPAKDLVLIAPENDADTIANLKIFVHEIFKTGDRLLTKNIFRFDREGKGWTIVDRVK